MTLKKLSVLAGMFLICLFATGVPYWQMPYGSLSLPNSIFNFGLALSLSCSLAFAILGFGFLWPAASFGMVAPAVVFLRIIMDTTHDASSHNLWPIEIAIAVFVGFSLAGFAAMLGVLARKTFRLSGKPD